MLVSLVIPAKNEGINVKNTLDSAFKVQNQSSFEVIVVDDGSTDGCCEFLEQRPGISSPSYSQVKLIKAPGLGVAQARNLGAQASRGDYLIFCDAHLFFEDYWIDRLIAPIKQGRAHATTPGIASTHNPQAIGYGQSLNRDLTINWYSWATKPFPPAVLPGGCIAIDRQVFFEVGGFDPGFIVWGFEDIEISIKLWLFGYTCLVEPRVKILHLFRETHPYPVTYSHVDYNLLRMAYSHFNDARIEKVKSLVKYSAVDELLEQLANSDTYQQRELYLARRKYDDDWYMKKFNIPF